MIPTIGEASSVGLDLFPYTCPRPISLSNLTDCCRRAEVLNFPDSAPPPPSGFSVIRTDEQKIADLKALGTERRRAQPKSSSYRGVSKRGSIWEALYRDVYLGRYEGEAEAASIYDQALPYDLGRCVLDPVH
jgi:hypothetical protein